MVLIIIYLNYLIIFYIIFEILFNSFKFMINFNFDIKRIYY